MIGQNRQAAFQQAKADHDFGVQGLELKTNTEMTRQIHLLTADRTTASWIPRRMTEIRHLPDDHTLQRWAPAAAHDDVISQMRCAIVDNGTIQTISRRP
jgi:uncharacterized membrane protein